MAVTSKSETFHIAFLLDADNLRLLSNLLEENVLSKIEENEVSPLVEKEISYKVDLSDGSSVSTESIEEVLDLPNSPKRKITSISIDTPYFFRRIKASVSLKDDSYRPVSYDLSGDYEEVITLADRLDDRLPGLRQWYSPLTRYSFFGILAVTCGVVFFSAYAFAAVDYFYPDFLAGEESEKIDTGLTGLVGVLFFLTVGVCLLLDWFRKKLFPVGTFAIGQGVDRYNRLTNIRNTILTGVVLAGVVGFVVNQIS